MEPPPCEDAEVVFAEFDTDMDGNLNRTEFSDALASMVRDNKVKAQLTSIYRYLQRLSHVSSTKRRKWSPTARTVCSLLFAVVLQVY